MRHYLACQEGLGWRNSLRRSLLRHAHRLTFRLPSGEERTFTSSLADDLEAALRDAGGAM